MSLPTIENLRVELDEINQELFMLYQLRQGKINAICEYKKIHHHSIWDPKREQVIFERFRHEFAEEPLSFYAQFSLLIENQLIKTTDYPRWSEGEHLASSSKHIRDFINPILLFTVNKSEYLKVNLKSEFLYDK